MLADSGGAQGGPPGPRQLCTGRPTPWAPLVPRSPPPAVGDTEKSSLQRPGGSGQQPGLQRAQGSGQKKPDPEPGNSCRPIPAMGAGPWALLEQLPGSRGPPSPGTRPLDPGAEKPLHGDISASSSKRAKEAPADRRAWGPRSWSELPLATLRVQPGVSGASVSSVNGPLGIPGGWALSPQEAT